MTDSTQLPLTLTYRKAFGRSDFIVAPCNREAVGWIDRWPDWPGPAVLILGESGAGKTHLASIFSEYHLDAADLTDDFMPYFQRKIVVENLERLASETALFHLFNFIRDLGGSLLMTARALPDFTLKDLKTRIQAVPKAVITMPDETVLRDVLKRTMAERQIFVDEAVLNYALTHMPRSFQSVQELIRRADLMSLAQGRKITVPVIREVLNEMGENACC